MLALYLPHPSFYQAYQALAIKLKELKHQADPIKLI